MTIRVVMPIAAYKVLRFMCDVGWPEYRLLETALIGKENVTLRCDNVAAQSLLDFAFRRCPEVVPHIKLTSDS